MLKSVFSIVTSRLLWGAAGISALAVVIWTVGPLVTIGDWRPVESARQRIVLISVLYLCWALCRLAPRLYRAWLNRRLLRSIGNMPDDDPLHPEHQDQQLAERFSEAMALLKKAWFTRSGHGQFRPRWLQRFNREYLYQLPWFVIIGAPGAGKTTALLNSGLQFPLAEHLGNVALRGAGGTRNCEWWLTNEAVLLDTAGRYALQQSHQQQDAGEWRRFITLLRKYRRHQPINGVIVTLSVSDLLSQDTENARQHALSLRQRLTELHELLGIAFPVYVLVTKVDLLQGFRAWSVALDKAQREQIWGFTFPWASSKQMDFALVNSVHTEFTLLQQRLEAGLPDSLQQESDGQMRADIYLFPQQFAALRSPLVGMIATLFSRSDFAIPFTPRGIYFTSATQEGLPFDRVMGELGRALQLPRPQAHSDGERDNWRRVDRESPIPAQKGQSFFIRALLQEVIFREAGLAGRNPWWELRYRALMWSGYCLILALLVMSAFLWLNSFSHNKNYLQEIQAKLPQLAQQNQQLQAQGVSDMLALLPLLNTLQQLAQSRNIAVESPPLSWRMGLYSGAEVHDASDTLYRQALRQLLLPQVAQAVTRWLSNNSSDEDYRYEALKAYQMLYQPRHYDGQFLHAWLLFNLRHTLPAETTRTQREQLENHLAQLLTTQIQTSPWARDDSLVAREQALIRQQPLAQRIYGRLKRMLEPEARLPAISLLSLGGPQSSLAFSRRSGTSLSEGIPGLFTPTGYWNHFSKQIAAVSESLHRDDLWVLGSQSPPAEWRQTESAVRQRYLSDFTARWDELLQDIQLNSSGDLSQRISLARLLSASDSPLRQLVVNVSRLLMLEPQPTAASSEHASSPEDTASNTLHNLQSLFATADAAVAEPQTTPEQAVSRHFAAFIQLAQPAGNAGGTIVFDEILQQVDELYRYLTAVQDAANSGMPPPASEPVSRLQASAGRLPLALQKMLTSLAAGASSDTQRRELEDVGKRLAVEVGGFCRAAIAGRYPLVSAAQSDITPDDLARMFAPGSGLMDTFFRTNLVSKVDTTQTNWRFMPGIDGKTLAGSEALLRPFRQAQSIRDAYFSRGATVPAFRVTLRTLGMDNDILNLTLDVDGQQLHFSHGPPAVQQVNWPGPGGTSQVRMQITLASGATASLVTNGPWALNRFFDRARLSAEAGNLSRQATFILDGHQVMLEFTPGSIRNPFQPGGFTCP